MDNIGIIIIHGFCGDTNEIEPLACELRQLGYKVLTPNLKGHTGNRMDLLNVTYHDWVSDVEKAYLQLKNQYETIILIGFSMGGLLSFQIAKKYDVKSIVTLNTPIYIGSIRNFLKHFLKDLLNLKFDYFKVIYGYSVKTPKCAFRNLQQLLNDTKKNLPVVTCDVQVHQSIEDEAVQYKSAAYLHKHIGSQNKQIKMYRNSNHMILQSEIAQDVISDVIEHVKKYHK